ncbi:hypothetical protein [Oryza sativa Japonica Group]|uniref:Uncharacterized protein P0702B09.28 n=1 Tax=Oryza sativa subsp. japonica TaxID=39947 RepID=Q5VR60_ORYSJ|nr:hypothetical protein [Oryza sativa Japonica Group]
MATAVRRGGARARGDKRRSGSISAGWGVRPKGGAKPCAMASAPPSWRFPSPARDGGGTLQDGARTRRPMRPQGGEVAALPLPI